MCETFLEIPSRKPLYGETLQRWRGLAFGMLGCVASYLVCSISRITWLNFPR
jgi:hypothetical protein